MLLNVLVDLSGALQRERTGLKLVQELLRRRRDDLKLGELIPLGDLWDVIAHRSGAAFPPPAADGLEPDYSMSTSLAPSRRRAARSSAHFKAQARRAVMAASSRP